MVVERPDGASVHVLGRSPDGTFSAVVPNARVGDRYRYRLDSDRLLPDPASRFQPDGVHGPSQIVDPQSFHWTDEGWRGLDLGDAVFYELHVGAFSPEGTFAGVTARLPYIAALGVSAIELMPVADFPGSRNWGYDGVALYAPARCYGSPDDLRQLVDAAHALGLGVFLDVVYNHLGPDGAYLSAFSPYYFTERHHTPWGAGLNLDGEHSGMVREFFFENALHWVHEYHLDGLRLDATHALADGSPRHFLAELTARVQQSVTARRVLMVAEDHRNLNWMMKPEAEGGWGVDAVWADAFHHQCRRLLAGDSEGYYRDYSGSAGDLAATIRRGWFYTGQFSTHLGERRGTDPTGLPACRFVICLQNHDQIGNRAHGERLHRQIEPCAYRAAVVVLLLAPETPLLFMGQEWAASTPFLYFTDHHTELGRLVTEGRRHEFRQFAAFADPATREQIPDPQAPTSFFSSRLLWNEQLREPHASVLRLHQALLAVRRRQLARHGAAAFHVAAIGDDTIVMRRDGPDDAFLIVARLRGAGVVNLMPSRVTSLEDDSNATSGLWRPILHTEDTEFCPDPVPPILDFAAGAATICFQRPSAIVLKRVRKTSAAGAVDDPDAP